MTSLDLSVHMSLTVTEFVGSIFNIPMKFARKLIYGARGQYTFAMDPLMYTGNLAQTITDQDWVMKCMHCTIPGFSRILNGAVA